MLLSQHNFFYREQNKSLKKRAPVMPILSNFLINWPIFEEQKQQLNHSTIQSSAILNSC